MTHLEAIKEMPEMPKHEENTWRLDFIDNLFYFYTAGNLKSIGLKELIENSFKYKASPTSYSVYYDCLLSDAINAIVTYCISIVDIKLAIEWLTYRNKIMPDRYTSISTGAGIAKYSEEF